MTNRDWRRLGNVDVGPFRNWWNLDGDHGVVSSLWYNIVIIIIISVVVIIITIMVKPAGVQHGEVLEEQSEEAQEAPVVMEAG